MAVVYCGFCVVFGRDLARGYGHGENCTYPETLSKQAACGLLKKKPHNILHLPRHTIKPWIFHPLAPNILAPALIVLTAWQYPTDHSNPGGDVCYRPCRGLASPTRLEPGAGLTAPRCSHQRFSAMAPMSSRRPTPASPTVRCLRGLTHSSDTFRALVFQRWKSWRSGAV